MSHVSHELKQILMGSKFSQTLVIANSFGPIFCSHNDKNRIALVLGHTALCWRVKLQALFFGCNKSAMVI